MWPGAEHLAATSKCQTWSEVRVRGFRVWGLGVTRVQGLGFKGSRDDHNMTTTITMIALSGVGGRWRWPVFGGRCSVAGGRCPVAGGWWPVSGGWWPAGKQQKKSIVEGLGFGVRRL